MGPAAFLNAAMSKVEGIPKWLNDAMIRGRRRVGIGVELDQIEVLRTRVACRVIAFGFVGLAGDFVEKPGWIRSGGSNGSFPLVRRLSDRSDKKPTRLNRRNMFGVVWAV
jgi:hypothetical protein